jgi:hypothetical protein
MRLRLWQWMVFVVYSALVLFGVEIVRGLPPTVQSWGAVFLVMVVAGTSDLLLLAAARPTPRRDLCTYILHIVALSTMVGLTAAGTPVCLAPRHKSRLPARLLSYTAEQWLVRVFPPAACTTFFLLGASAFPRRCPGCGKPGMIAAAGNGEMEGKPGDRMTYCWCVCCSTKMKTEDGAAWFDASGAQDSRFYKGGLRRALLGVRGRAARPASDQTEVRQRGSDTTDSGAGK